MRIRRIYIVWAALVLVGIALLPRLALFASHSFAVVTHPWQIDFDEGIILNSSWLLAQGHSPYPQNGPQSFVSSVYQPLFYVLNAVALKLWGLNLWSGRALSVVGTLLAAAAIAVWTAAETRGKAAGLLAGALWLALGPVIVWASFYKQDILALGLGAAGCAVLAWQYPLDRCGAAGPGRVLLGLPLLAWAAIGLQLLAFWTKQSAVASLVASAAYLIWINWRVGLRWTVVAAWLVGGSFLLLNFITHGQLYAHLSMASNYEPSLNQLRNNMYALWEQHWALLIIGGAAALAALARAAFARRPLPLSLIYAACCVPVLVLTNLSPYANYNHLLDGLLPLCLLVGVGLGELAGAVSKRRVLLLPLVGAAGLLVVQVALFVSLGWWYGPLDIPLEQQAAHMANLERALEATPGEIVLSEDIWLALRAGKQVPFDDTVQLAARAEGADSVLLQYIRQHQFSLILLEYDVNRIGKTERWSEQGLADLKANYSLLFADLRYIYKPNDPPASVTQQLNCKLAGGPTLVGIDLPGAGKYLAAGGVQPVSLYWKSGDTGAAQNLKFSLRLTDPEGDVVWQADLSPGAVSGQAWPGWAGGAAPRDDLQMMIPQTLLPGSYTITLTAYTQQGDAFGDVPFNCNGTSTRTMALATPEVLGGAN